MKLIGIYAKHNNPKAVAVAKELKLWLGVRGVEVLLESELAADMGEPAGVDGEQLPNLVECIVVLGGDGTLISVARKIGALDVPILGVNLGSLGFLTEITLDDLYDELECVLVGNYAVSSRIMLQAAIIRDGAQIAEYQVLNDVVINKGALARIVDMEVWIDDHYLTTFKADGLIVSTPTGSTAYNLAAGGPIIYPGLRCLVITPICAHTLTNRPIIVSDEAVMRITMRMNDERVFMTADGQVGMALQAQDIIEIRIANMCTKLIKSASKEYFEVLRTKLRWGER
jgi:NAD+ kinase